MILPVVLLVRLIAPQRDGKRTDHSQHQKGAKQHDLRGQIAEMLTTEQVVQAAPHCRGQHQENSTKYKELDADVMASSLTFLAPALIGDADGSPCPRNHRQLRVCVAAGDCP